MREVSGSYKQGSGQQVAHLVSHPGLPHRCCWPGPSKAHLWLCVSPLFPLCVLQPNAVRGPGGPFTGLVLLPFVLGGLTSPVFLGWITSASHPASLNCSPIVDSRNTPYPLPFCNWNRFQWSQIFFFLSFLSLFPLPCK